MSSRLVLQCLHYSVDTSNSAFISQIVLLCTIEYGRILTSMNLNVCQKIVQDTVAWKLILYSSVHSSTDKMHIFHFLVCIVIYPSAFFKAWLMLPTSPAIAQHPCAHQKHDWVPLFLCDHYLLLCSWTLCNFYARSSK